MLATAGCSFTVGTGSAETDEVKGVSGGGLESFGRAIFRAARRSDRRFVVGTGDGDGEDDASGASGERLTDTEGCTVRTCCVPAVEVDGFTGGWDKTCDGVLSTAKVGGGFEGD